MLLASTFGVHQSLIYAQVSFDHKLTVESHSYITVISFNKINDNNVIRHQNIITVQSLNHHKILLITKEVLVARFEQVHDLY